MVVKDTDLISLLEKAFKSGPPEKLDEIGTVIKAGDSITRVYGLTNAVYGELIVFEGGNQGIVFDLDEDFVSVVLLNNDIPVMEQETAKSTGDVLRVPVGAELLGRVLSATGKPLDALGKIKTEHKMPLEQMAPGILERTPVNEPLETGITAIDSLIPIGKGQRELLIGNRHTGKSSIAIDTILNQKNKNVVCIYVSIGHKQLSTARILRTLENNDAMSYTIIVDADAKETAINQFLAPYTACTIGEHLMRQGRDVLIVYDSLSNHAIAYRELSLLLRRPPGRPRPLLGPNRSTPGRHLLDLPLRRTMGHRRPDLRPVNEIPRNVTRIRNSIRILRRLRHDHPPDFQRRVRQAPRPNVRPRNISRNIHLPNRNRNLRMGGSLERKRNVRGKEERSNKGIQLHQGPMGRNIRRNNERMHGIRDSSRQTNRKPRVRRAKQIPVEKHPHIRHRPRRRIHDKFPMVRLSQHKEPNHKRLPQRR